MAAGPREEGRMRSRRSIGAPLTVGIVVGLLVLALAVGWQILVWSGSSPRIDSGSPLNALLLILGTLFFVLVLAGLFWLSSWLVSEMRVNQRQRAFLDAVTHELKTPLASFRLGLDTLGRHDLSFERRSEFIERMQEDLDRLDQTVRQVLVAARAEERGRLAWRQLGRVEVVAVIERCAQQICAQHKLAESAVTFSGAREAWARAERSGLELIFGNLLENAAKYSGDAVDVRVHVEVNGEGRVSIEIADRGMGIAPRELRRIFHRFYRSGHGATAPVGGLGLGLFVARAMVIRQGGRIVARSEGAGQGSRFLVTLRAASPVVSGGSLSDSQSELSHSKGRAEGAWRAS
ncbi:MAG: hypothetical protein CL936_15805 [Deltaproteobacteria bacterium]|nr:hypothetical protein [Deltaproteobacteria bacterium]